MRITWKKALSLLLVFALLLSFAACSKKTDGTDDATTGKKSDKTTASEKADPTAGDKADPTDGESAPTDGESAPTDGKTDPTDGKTDPIDGKIDPTDGKTDPTNPSTDPTQPHIHSYDAVVTEPTCTEGGYTTYTCDCGDSYVADEAVALGHQYENKVCKLCGERKPSEGLEFTLNDDGESYSVTGIGTCVDADIVIPATYDGKPVTSIGYSAFYGCSSLTSITIPDSVTSIGSEAFCKCSRLKSIAIPDSVTSIGDSAFYWCRSLTSITIPNSVTSIGDSAFNWCRSLTSITIPDSVTSIGLSAFEYCSSLTSITIPDSVTSIGLSAFSYCSSLTSVTIPFVRATGRKEYTSLNYIFGGGVSNSLETVIITGGSSIGDYAFRDCSSLKSITIPNSVTRIGHDAFSGCSSLNAVYISDLAAWCNISFDGHDSNPLYYAHNLYINGELATNIVVPDGVTSIRSYAFSGCSSLTSITLPDSVTSIGDYAFYNCSSLTSITIPDGVTSIGAYAFYDTAYYNSQSNWTNGIWTNGILYIGNHLIAANKNFSGAYTIREGTKCIADYAFYDCSSLTSITIPDSVTSIGDYAFEYCSSLTDVTIGNGITSIGWEAFYYCGKLENIYFKGTKGQWQEIIRCSDWDYDTGDYTVHCTDGDISK